MKVSKSIIKAISIICAVTLFIAVFNLPIIYYFPLRVIVFIGAIVFTIINYKNLFVLMIFSLIAVLFNPIFPMYLYIKSYWIPIDIITGILFLLAGYYDIRSEKEKSNTVVQKTKSYTRDKIY
jgi:membrane-bound ClpP family serine protease